MTSDTTQGSTFVREGWLTVCGRSDAGLERVLADRVAKMSAASTLTEVERHSVANQPIRFGRSDRYFEPVLLERLRHACQTWEVDLVSERITSHRRFVGPLIVTGKKLVFRILRPLLRGFIVRQRNFNAEVVYTLAVLANRLSELEREPPSGRRADT